MQDVAFNDQRTVTDEQFLDHLTLPGDAGRQLIAARKSGDAAGAVTAVAQHFRTRKGPRWPFYMHGTPWLEINGRGRVLEKADALLKNRVRNCWPPFQEIDLTGEDGELDWQKGFEQAGGSIARNTFLPELTTAFSLTGKTAYLIKARDLMKSLVAAHPWVLHEGFYEDHDRYFGTGYTLDLGLASQRWIDLMHSGALHVPNVFSDADVFWMVKQLWFHSMQYYRYVGDVMRRDNHHLGDHGNTPFVLGVAFPEFSVSGALIEQGRKTFQHHFKLNIFSDGTYAEHSTKYQYHFLYMYTFVHALAKANHEKLFTPSQAELLAKWVEFSARACKPDGILSDFGDEFGGSLGHLFGTLAAPVMSKRLAALGRALGYEPGELMYETPDGLSKYFRDWQQGYVPRIGLSPWYSAGHQETRRVPTEKDLPDPASIQYPKGGYTFLRSDWSRDADFLGVSHYTDCLPHGHAHWDPMSFVLHTQGKTLIGDPATWVYTDPRNWSDREFRGYGYSVDAHNCMVLNDDTLKTLKALGHPCCWGGYPPKHGLGIFEAGGPIEVTELWHDAYAPIRHRRFVVQIPGIGFIFVDLASREGLDLRPHQYSQLYHLELGVEPSPIKFEGKVPMAEGGRPIKVSCRGAGALIVPGHEADSSWKFTRDARLAGVKAAGGKTDDDGPWIVELTRRTQGPCVFTTFMLTQWADKPASAVLRYLGSHPAKHMYQQHDGFSAHILELGDAGRVYIASCPYGKPLNTPEFSTDAELAVVVEGGSGRIQSWAMARGSKLSVKKRTLATRRRDWQAG